MVLGGGATSGIRTGVLMSVPDGRNHGGCGPREREDEVATSLQTVEVAKLDNRFSGLRLTDPTALTRLRQSVQREGVRSTV